MARLTAVVFDFDGTLVDSDEALVAPFLTLGVPPEQISFGHAVAEECERLGIDLDAYVDAYDTEAAQPFPGVEQMLDGLGRWALCSNKHPRSGSVELARLGWRPDVAVFADHFEWAHKSLRPVLDLLDVGADEVLMVGDSDGDLRCAQEVGCAYAWAGWNPRVRKASPTGTVLDGPGDILDLLF